MERKESLYYVQAVFTTSQKGRKWHFTDGRVYLARHLTNDLYTVTDNLGVERYICIFDGRTHVFCPHLPQPEEYNSASCEQWKLDNLSYWIVTTEKDLKEQVLLANALLDEIIKEEQNNANH